MGGGGWWGKGGREGGKEMKVRIEAGGDRRQKVSYSLA